jgi:hypothetical protein
LVVEPLLSIAASGLEIVSSFRGLKRPGPNDSEQAARVVEALRAIYFVPAGVIGALRKLASNDALTGHDVAEFERFDAHDEKVYEATSRLDFEKLLSLPVFSIRAARELELIRWNKINLRRDVREALHSHIRQGRTIKADEANRLLELVVSLNEQIESAEEHLNFLQAQRPAPGRY